MAGLIPFNLMNNGLTRTGSGFDNFYNILDDFFNDSWLSGHSLSGDTFKIDIEETDAEYLVEAELPGVGKDEIDLSIDNENLCISVNHLEKIDKDGKNYIHRERRTSSMSRRVRFVNAKLDDIKAKLEDGVLRITIPKDEKAVNSRKIDIE